MDTIFYFLTVLKASLFSTGGFGPLPALHADFLANGWAVEKHFTEALSIGQITPGPNGLWVVSLCFLSLGILPAWLSALALALPPLLSLFVQNAYEKISHIGFVQGILDGVVLVVSTFSLLVLGNLFAAGHPDFFLFAIAAISAFLAIKRLLSANLILFFAALIGILFR